MFDYIKGWMGKDEKRNRVTWNSAKVPGIKIDLLKPKNYVKKIILMLISALIGLIVLVRKFKKVFKGCVAF